MKFSKNYHERDPCTCRHVMLPKEIAKLAPKDKLMSEAEWRKLGVQQSQGWIHYMFHKPGTHTYTHTLELICHFDILTKDL